MTHRCQFSGPPGPVGSVSQPNRAYANLLAWVSLFWRCCLEDAFFNGFHKQVSVRTGLKRGFGVGKVCG